MQENKLVSMWPGIYVPIFGCSEPQWSMRDVSVALDLHIFLPFSLSGCLSDDGATKGWFDSAA